MKWQHITFACVVLATSLVVTGCNLLSENKKFDYKSASKLPALEVPPDLIAPSIDERYTIPDANPSGSATFSTYNQERSGQPRTGSTAVLPTSDKNIRIERAGTQRWLVIPQAPEVVWPIIKEFWQELGFLIKVELPEAGIIETDWAENRAKIPQDFIRTFLSTFLDSLYSSAERDKFRTRLERGENGTTEVYISHRGMDEVVEGGSTQRTVWQPRAADPDLEAEMLSRLMIRFGAEEDRARLELTTINSSASQVRAYISPEQRDVLNVNEAFDRSWRRVGLALDRVGFTVEDRNRVEGIYFVRYVDPDSDKKKTGDDDGILSKALFWRKNKDNMKAEKYRIQISETGTSSSQVRVFNEDNAPVNSRTANRILNLLYEQLK
ncbi:MAG: outer membrane protein assembly factor BamC [Nitrosomonas sp.]|nr:outer membrane protein assembly factor BamC [Nitrosomonas sp.]MDP1951485.1 outer membrane protein assembly factor BamC [Nitrosomonas sp.]